MLKTLPPTTKELTRWLTLDLVPDPDQPRKEFSEESLLDLAQSMTQQGQLVPLIVYRDPTNDKRAIIVDGERRFRAALRCAKPMESLDVLLLPEKPNALELLKAQMAVNQLRESLTASEECAAYLKLMREGQLSQARLAQELGVSESKVSKVLARQRIEPSLLPQVESLDLTVTSMIAQVPPEQQADVVAFAMAPGESGRRPTRDQVQAYLQARKPQPKRPSRTQHFCGTLNGRSFRVSLAADDSHDTLVESLKQLIAFVQKHKAVPVSNLSILTAT